MDMNEDILKKERMEEIDKKIEKEKKRNKLKKKLKWFILAGVIFILAGGASAYLLLTEKEDERREFPDIEIPVARLTIVDEDSNARPIAVMLDNNVGNAAHAGLQESIVNYEIIVEGGMTRIMAVFKDKDVSLIGPVRSARHYFLDYAAQSDALYVHFGWSPISQSDISSLNVNNVNGLYDDQAFWRDNTIPSPHNVFTNTSTIYQFVRDHRNFPVETENWRMLNWSAEEVVFPGAKFDDETGELVLEDPRIQVNSVRIQYSPGQVRSYTFDFERGVYLRYMNNAPHVDKVTRETLHFKNVIIERVANASIDNEGRQGLTTVGAGTGYFITNGFAMPITWERESRTGRTTYRYLDGSIVWVNDGNTFVQVVPMNASVLFE